MGHPHRLDKRLAAAASRIARRDALKRGYAAVDGRSAPEGNVVALRPANRRPPASQPATDPPADAQAGQAGAGYISATPLELRYAEAALVETLNAALVEGILELRAMLADPYTTDDRKLKVFGMLTTAKNGLTRTLAASARHNAWSADTPHLSDEQRRAFDTHQKAQALLALGFTITLPDGRMMHPRDREPMPVEE